MRVVSRIFFSTSGVSVRRGRFRVGFAVSACTPPVPNVARAAITVGRDAVRVRLPEREEISAAAKPLDKTKEDSVSYLRAVLFGDLKPEGQSSLETNVMVTEILDAARKSAATGKTVSLAEMP